MFVLTCYECNTSWHVDCVGLKEITEAPLRKLKTWKCALCITLPQNILEKLRQNLCKDITDIPKQMEEMEKRLNSKIEEIKNTKPPYSNMVQSENLQAKVNNTNKIVKSLVQRNGNKKDTEEAKLKNEKTLIIKKYMDPEARKRNNIRRTISKEYPGVGIENARTTVGGSILIEFEDKETAEKVKKQWNKNLFGGNQGVTTKKTSPPAGIVKHVMTEDLEDEEYSDDDIISEVKETFPDVEVDLFKKDNKFTGTLKIQFSTEDELGRAMNNGIKLFQQKHKIERYNYKPRVIICKFCQRFSHVSRICESRLKGHDPKCGKCTDNDHETKDCEKQQKDYKCCHCEGNHETGSKDCEVMKLKLEELYDRTQNGY